MPVSQIDQDRIEKQIEIDAPVSRVWAALTDHRQFGEWFLVNMESPFVPGRPCSGQLTHPGYEHIRMELAVQRIEPEHFFSFTWHPFAVEPGTDYSQETPTLVEFTLGPTGRGTLLRVVESGFAGLPAHRRDLAFRMNDSGWRQQMNNIAAYVARHP